MSEPLQVSQVPAPPDRASPAPPRAMSGTSSLAMALWQLALGIGVLLFGKARPEG